MKISVWMTIALVVGMISVGNAAPIKAIGTIDTYFSPRGGTTEAIVAEIDRARKEILIQAYSFTSVPIAKALLQANRRGVRIETVLDKSNRKKAAGKANYSAAVFLTNHPFPPSSL